jgi:transposase-like protein
VVVDVLVGKATVDQVARRLGVQASTVEGWRDDAMDGIAKALWRGSGKTVREPRANARSGHSSYTGESDMPQGYGRLCVVKASRHRENALAK